MKSVNAVIFFALCNFISGSCTIIASTGYIASNPFIRNLLIRTGISDKIRSQANTLYHISGFKYASDQGTGIRKASTNTHEIIEVGAKENHRRKRSIDESEVAIRSQLQGQVQRFDAEIRSRNQSLAQRSAKIRPQSQDRIYSEQLFSVLNQMDRNTCISKLLCEIGADYNSYGMIGQKINHFVRSVPPVTWNSATFPYIESFQSGLSNGKTVCSQHYGTCSYDLKRVMVFLWHFLHPMKF